MISNEKTRKYLTHQSPSLWTSASLKGCKRVAGVERAARYPRITWLSLLTLNGSQNSSGTLSGCECLDPLPGGLRFAATPATFVQPFGLQILLAGASSRRLPLLADAASIVSHTTETARKVQ